jgi:nucleoside-diphosphate-sugar epimerase
MTELSTPPAPPVLILGVTGAVGHAIGLALHQRGIPVHALVRNVAAARAKAPYVTRWFVGDAMDRASIAAAAADASVIVHGVNPPGYVKWRELAVPMLANTLSVAVANRATVVFPCNVYVYGMGSPAVVTEATPFAPTTEKGRIRVEMEGMVEAATAQGARAILVRAGDFFGPGYINSWFRQAVAKGGRQLTRVQTLTPEGVGHSWAYLPDLGETFARLIEQRAMLAAFERVNFGGHYDEAGRAFAHALRRVVGKPDLPIKPFAWWQVALASPFVPFLREAYGMRWLWRHPLKLDNARLVRLIGPEPHTPLDTAIAATLD